MAILLINNIMKIIFSLVCLLFYFHFVIKYFVINARIWTTLFISIFIKSSRQWGEREREAGEMENNQFI